jgi:hypothetical protein
MPYLRSHCARRLVLAVLAGCAWSAAASGSEFPFGSKLVLDAAPLPGAKRIPMIRVEKSGAVTANMWCPSSNLKFQAKVADDTIKLDSDNVLPSDYGRGCDTLIQTADFKLTVNLFAITAWSRQDDLITFVLGGIFTKPTPTMALRIQR